MKKLNIKLVILTTFLLTIFLHGFSQITVTKIKDSSTNTTNEGFIYTLPHTVLKVEIVYEKVQKLKGPLSEYANEYLGSNDYIASNGIEFNLLNANISVSQEADPGQLYYVQYPAEKAKDAKSISFTLSDIGSLLSYNTTNPITIETKEIVTDQTFIYAEGDHEFPYMYQYNKQKKIDTVIRKINIDTVTINRFLFNASWVDKSIDDKAKEAALQIEKIRESRYHLISGYQEVNYGTSIIYMDQQMQNLENKYIELFQGKEIKTIENRTFFLVPEKNKNITELFRFDDGKSVTLKITPDNTASILPEVPSSKINSIYYRIPASADISIVSDDQNFFDGRFTINQLGIISSAPLGNTALQFDQKTGNLINIVRD